MCLPDDRFVPLRIEDLVREVGRDAASFGPVCAEARALAGWMRRVIAQEGEALHARLEHDYHPFDPDRDTLVSDDYTAERVRGLERALIRDIDYLFEKANYERLAEPMVEQAILAANTQGLRVRIDPEKIAHLYLYVRGRSSAMIRRRTIRAPIRGRQQEVELYRRLGVVAQLRDHHAVVLKCFRDIPLTDLEALLPHASVQMSLWDKLQVAAGGAGALGGLVKIVPPILAGGLAALSGFFWTILLAVGALLLRSFFGYRRAKSKRESQRTRNLLARNLANNASVVHTLVRKIMEEEVKEAFLAYCTVAGGGARGAVFATDQQIDAACEAWLQRRLGVRVNFDCTDALETLDRFGLWVNRDARRVLPPESAVAVLQDHWVHGKSAGYHDRCLERHPFMSGRGTEAGGTSQEGT